MKYQLSALRHVRAYLMGARDATVVGGPVDREYEIIPSTLETIDQAFYNWLDEKLDIFATTNRGWNKVPLIWVSAERAFQVKEDKDLRDKFGVLKLPLITIERSSIVKDATPSVIEFSVTLISFTPSSL